MWNRKGRLSRLHGGAAVNGSTQIWVLFSWGQVNCQQSNPWPSLISAELAAALGVASFTCVFSGSLLCSSFRFWRSSWRRAEPSWWCWRKAESPDTAQILTFCWKNMGSFSIMVMGLTDTFYPSVFSTIPRAGSACVGRSPADPLTKNLLVWEVILLERCVHVAVQYWGTPRAFYGQRTLLAA